MIEFPIQKIIDEFSIPEPKERDGSYWHPSALGGCMRGVYLDRKGVECPEPFEPRTYRIFELGHAVEDLVVKKLFKGAKQHGYEVEYQKKILIPEWSVRGTMDFRINSPQGSKIYDVKSCNSRKFKFMRKRGGADEHYKEQVWLYLYGDKVDEGAILYVSKDDQYLAEYPVYLNDMKLAKRVEEKLKVLNDCWEKNELPPLAPTFNDDGTRNWMANYCRWHTICTGNPNWKDDAYEESKAQKIHNILESKKSRNVITIKRI